MFSRSFQTFDRQVLSSSRLRAAEKRTRRSRFSMWSGGLVLLTAALFVVPVAAGEKSLPPQQPGDDVTEPPKSVQERSQAEQQALDAMAHFMAGRLYQSRDNLRKALDSYKKAAEIDPNAIEAYRAIIPLALSLDMTDDAIEYALKAAKLAPEDYEVLRQLGDLMIRRQKLDDAIELFSKASQLESLDKKSWAYVALQRDLGILQITAGNAEQAADAYAVPYDAIVNPDDYDLTIRQRAELMSDNRTSYERFAEVFLAADRPEKALEALNLASQNRRSTPGHLSYESAQVYLKLKDYDEARKRLQEYFNAQRQSKGQDAYALLEKILVAQGKEDEFLPELEKLLDSDGHNVPLLLFTGQEYLDAGRTDRAEEVFRLAIKDGAGVEGQLGLARLYREQKAATPLLETLAACLSQASGENLAALEAEMTALSEDTELTELVLAQGTEAREAEPPRLSFEQAYILAKVAVAADEVDEAAAYYTFALSRAGNRARMIYGELGTLYTANDRYAEAAEIYQQAAADPAQAGQRTNYLLLLSQALAMNGDTTDAIDAIRAAQQAVPNHPLLEFQEAWIFYHARDWDQAIPKFEQVIEKFRNVKDILRRSQFSLSNIHVQRGDIRKGEEILEEILEEEPDDPAVNNDLGYLYADQGKHLEKAETMIRKAVAAEPENAAYLDSLGWVLYRLGRHEEAVEPLKKAIDKLSGSGDSTIWDHLGDAYHALDRSEEAIEAWKHALQAAKADANPDAELIGKIEAKLAGQ